jgi:hypothetical protein
VSLSPNGRLVLWFVKGTVGGANGHYVVTLADGSASRVIELAGGWSVRWSPDGTRLIGVPSSAGQAVPPRGLMIVDPTAAETPVTIQDDSVLLGWSWQGLP